MSKRCILICLLIFLISACAPQVTVPPTPEAVQSLQPVPSNTVKPESTMDVVAAWTSIAGTKDAMVRPADTASPTAVDTATAAFSLCPGAPGPYVAVGKQVTVVAENVDKLKLRSSPALAADTVLQELDRFTQLTVVGGPVCVREVGASYWFWQVEVHPGGEVGWVAEGDVTHSFIIVSVGQQHFPQNTPTAPTPSACPPIRGPYGPGVQATVVTDNSDKLKLRSAPVISPDNIVQELDQYATLEIVGGPMCVRSAETGIGYWLWKVKVLSGGKTGWVAEGDGRNHFIEPIIPP